MSKIRLIVVDDHPIFIEGIFALLRNDERFDIVGFAHNGKDALDLVKKTNPDIAMLDINMPGMDGIEVCKALKERFPSVKAIMLTMHDDYGYIKKLLEAGARGYVLKNTTREALGTAITTVFDGQPYLDPAVQEAMIKSVSGGNDNNNGPAFSNIEALTKRELEILQQIAYGHTSADISKKLFISKNTVETHRKNLLTKLNVKNTAEMIKIALQNGLV